MTRDNMTPDTSSRAGTPARPRIIISATDHARLMRLAEVAQERAPSAGVADYLSDELSRAQIVPDGEMDASIIRMGSRVTYSDAASGRTRKVSLVYPEAADINLGLISVLTPIGAALIGLSPGQSIDWPTPGGGSGKLTVLEVDNEESAEKD